MSRMPNLPLWDTNRLAHRGDPATSKQAAAKHTGSGIRAIHSEIILAAVREFPGQTATELMRPTGLAEYQVRRRLSDLKAAGMVRQGDPRICEAKGTRMVTWWVVRDE